MNFLIRKYSTIRKAFRPKRFTTYHLPLIIYDGLASLCIGKSRKAFRPKRFTTYHLPLTTLVLFLAFAAQAAEPLKHNFGFSASAGWSTLVCSSADINPGNGFNTALEFRYELQKRHFLFDTGLGAGWRSMGAKVADSTFMFSFADQDLYVDVARRNDQLRQTELIVPMMAGGQFGNFAFLAGLKLCIPLARESRTTAYFTTSDKPITDPSSINQVLGYVSDYQQVMKQDKPFLSPVDLMLSAELGYTCPFPTKATLAEAEMAASQEPYSVFPSAPSAASSSRSSVTNCRLRFSLYADYSYLPFSRPNKGDMLIVDEAHPQAIALYQMPAAYTLNDPAYYLAGLNLGVRLTFLFGK